MKTENGTVSLTYKDETGKEKTEESAVSYKQAETADDVLSLLQGSDDEVKAIVTALNYGLNLKARAAVRAELQAKVEGPAKNINKMVADLMKAKAAVGKPISEEDARKRVLALLDMDDAAAA